MVGRPWRSGGARSRVRDVREARRVVVRGGDDRGPRGRLRRDVARCRRRLARRRSGQPDELARGLEFLVGRAETLELQPEQ
jgi:hypothetical protein